MLSWRLPTIAVLFFLPLTLFSSVGIWALWKSGHLWWLSWTLPVCWGLVWLLARQLRQQDVPLPKMAEAQHWTERDLQAKNLAEGCAERILRDATSDQLLDATYMRERTIELAGLIGRHYHPRAVAPIDALSVVEVLAVARLVAEDMEQFVLDKVPASHLVTIAQWKALRHTPRYVNYASNAITIASIAFDITTLPRHIFMRLAGNELMDRGRVALLQMLVAQYFHLVGHYLIELNSGRLRVGSTRYRQFQQHLRHKETGTAPSVAEGTSATPAAAEPIPSAPATVTIAILGQVKAGKSSLVNGLLGERQAAVDALPATPAVTRYMLRLEDVDDRLTLLDTPGYGQGGATEEEYQAALAAAREADVILLAMAANSPAKDADVRLLDRLQTFFASQRQLKSPPLIGVVTKVDALSPVMEWAPPYDWTNPQRPKEIAIRDAVEYAREALGGRVEVLLPICADLDRDRLYGVEEWLLPTLMLTLDQGRACALLRSLHRDYDAGKAWRVFQQFAAAGRALKDALVQRLAAGTLRS